MFWLALSASTVAFLVPVEAPIVDSALPFTSWFGLPWDRVVHTLVFGLLAAIGVRAHLVAGGDRRLRLLVLVVGLLVYALAIEACQHVLPWRAFEIWDLVADAAGTTLGVVWMVAFRPFSPPEP